MTRAEMLGRMSSSEYSDWRAFFLMEPFGPVARDQRMAHTSSILWTRYTKKGKRFDVEDLMLSEQPDKSVDVEAAVDQIAAINQAVGGRDMRGKDG